MAHRVSSAVLPNGARVQRSFRSYLVFLAASCWALLPTVPITHMNLAAPGPVTAHTMLWHEPDPLVLRFGLGERNRSRFGGLPLQQGRPCGGCRFAAESPPFPLPAIAANNARADSQQIHCRCTLRTCAITAPCTDPLYSAVICVLRVRCVAHIIR